MSNEQLVLEAKGRGRVRVLLGEDDGHPFRVIVPMRVRTVGDALAWLQPDEVPDGALRQGEFYFVPRAIPLYCERHDSHQGGVEPGCRFDEYTEAGSHYTTRCRRGSFSPTHRATACLAIVRSGDVCFVGRRAVKQHSFVGRPRYFVRGEVSHPEHGDLVLGDTWHEVIPNRAHGPFPVALGGRDFD